MDAIDRAAAPVRVPPTNPSAATAAPAAEPVARADADRAAARAAARSAAAADLADPAADLAATPAATADAPPAGSRVSARAWIMWSAAVTVYFVAVFNRSSLGVAGPDAEQRFGINAASLSTFSMLQLLVYAAMQIPVGLLVDRFGPRKLLVTGLTVICLAQAAFAAVDSFGLALLARGLLGCGDAMVFISVLRIVVAWFPSSRVALVTQLTSLAGAAGGIASAWPLAWALRELGWSGTFLAVAAIGACVIVLPAGVVRDTPHGSASHVTRQTGRLRDQMRGAWSRPHTRLGLWIHFTTGFPAAVFSLLWGYPFLVQGEGVGTGLASALLTLLICANMACCFAFGVLLTRRPQLRVPLALGVAASTALALTAVLLWPGRAPLWLLVVLVLAYSGNGAGSMIGFDVARSTSPPEQLGTASGMVNIGTFIASAITLVATGILVDATGAEHAASAAAALDGFKVAFCFPYLLLALGSIQIVRLARTVRRGADASTGGLSLSWSYQQGVPVRQD